MQGEDSGNVISIRSFRERKSIRAATDLIGNAIDSRDQMAGREAALEARYGRYFRFEQDFELHGKVPYLLVDIKLPRDVDRRERQAWKRRGAMDISSVGCLAREHPDSPQTTAAIDGSNLFWITDIHLPLTPSQALRLMTQPLRSKIQAEFGLLRTENTVVETSFDMAGMDRFDITRHPAYEAVFGSTGRCFSVMLSNRHMDPQAPHRALQPWRYGSCVSVEDVAEAAAVIARLQRRVDIAGADNVTDLTTFAPRSP